MNYLERAHHRVDLSTMMLTGFTALLALCAGVQAFAADPTTIPPARLTEIAVAGTTPMGAAPINLTALGYTEREFYAVGMANRYDGAQSEELVTAKILDSNWPFKTRVLVRAPAPEKFNGTLVVEWANVTAGQDIDFAFAEGYEYLTREGYAIAVVSAQRVGVDRLKTWSPQRYGTLSVGADNLNPKDGSKIDDCPMVPACPGDPLSWDIMSQVTRALKDNSGNDQPLPGLAVEK